MAAWHLVRKSKFVRSARAMDGCHFDVTASGNRLRAPRIFVPAVVDFRKGVMGWFRTYRKFAGHLALFALALQFYLSFAHIHPDDIYGPLGRSLQVAETVDLPAAESLKSIPSGQPWYSDDALCPICETIYFLATSFTPSAPEILPLIVASRPAEHSAVCAALFVAPRRAFFQSRAPPLV